MIGVSVAGAHADGVVLRTPTGQSHQSSNDCCDFIQPIHTVDTCIYFVFQISARYYCEINIYVTAVEKGVKEVSITATHYLIHSTQS